MDAAQAEQVCALMHEVIAALPYYNHAAKTAEIGRYTAAYLRASIRDDPDAVLVAVNNEQCVGFCVSRPDDGTIWLSWFGTHPDWRGMGLGQRLLHALENTVRTKNIHKIWCDSRTENVPSRAALARAGFREICTIPNHWYGQDFVLLEKLLI